MEADRTPLEHRWDGIVTNGGQAQKEAEIFS
jgi:hypothetical protein